MVNIFTTRALRLKATQRELGKLIGVQKAQISRLENNASNVTMDTLIKVFTALKAKVELPYLNISVGK